jgi:hypothetical protein
VRNEVEFMKEFSRHFTLVSGIGFSAGDEIAVRGVAGLFGAE